METSRRKGPARKPDAVRLDESVRVLMTRAEFAAIEAEAQRTDRTMSQIMRAAAVAALAPPIKSL